MKEHISWLVQQQQAATTAPLPPVSADLPPASLPTPSPATGQQPLFAPISNAPPNQVNLAVASPRRAEPTEMPVASSPYSGQRLVRFHSEGAAEKENGAWHSPRAGPASSPRVGLPASPTDDSPRSDIILPSQPAYDSEDDSPITSV
eukprot:TRINITY_DN48736_c0_g1_i1.p1 TRINITY_DN48736_c0_g1~~TRINITY_DN48736_c0_g1_i1.p1  ORF type:complete len:147 (+),score=12.01 TRINITY_DN48736_c0_g1_i1:68-508(+)